MASGWLRRARRALSGDTGCPEYGSLILREAEVAEERETLRVLRELTDLLRPDLHAIRAVFEMCLAVDQLVARARYAVAMRGEVPAVEPAPELVLRPLAFDQLDGWREDDPREALVAFRRSCTKLHARGAGPRHHDHESGEVVARHEHGVGRCQGAERHSHHRDERHDDGVAGSHQDDPADDIGGERHAEAHTTPPSELLLRLAEETRAELRSPTMLSGAVAGGLLEVIVFALRAEGGLELGT